MNNEIRDDLKYTDSHEWLKIKDNIVVIGITDYAQSEMTDIVFAELPDVGKKLNKGDELCVVESVKSVSEIYSPISGKVVKINNKLEDSPETINKSPYDEGWLVELEVIDNSELENLLDAKSYKEIL
jgi:glycine cleavage system H protein